MDDASIQQLAGLIRNYFHHTIEKVTVKKLRLSSRVKRGDRITLEADTSENPDAVYDLLDQIRKSIPLAMYSITQVEIAASIMVSADIAQGRKAETIRQHMKK